MHSYNLNPSTVHQGSVGKATSLIPIHRARGARDQQAQQRAAPAPTSPAPAARSSTCACDRTAACVCVASASPSRTLARTVVRLRGRSSDMVAIIEVVFLIACLLLGVCWVSRTSRFRSRKSSRAGSSEHRRSPRHQGGSSEPRLTTRVLAGLGESGSVASADDDSPVGLEVLTMAHGVSRLECERGSGVGSPHRPLIGMCVRPDSGAGSGRQRNTSASACDGVLKPSVCRGRPLSLSAMASKSVWVRVRKSRVRGRY